MTVMTDRVQLSVLTLPLLAALGLWPVERSAPAALTPAEVGGRLVPRGIQQVLDRACADCHSDRPNWPWYTRVAPIRWVIEGQAANGRRAVNFSTWKPGAGPTRARAARIFAAACADVQTGRMPMPLYRALQPASRLTRDEADDFCRWTELEARRLRQGSVVLHSATPQAAPAPSFYKGFTTAQHSPHPDPLP
jgi:hypothetical protein